MSEWIPVIGTLGGTAVGSFFTWLIVRGQSNEQRARDRQRERAVAYSRFLTAGYEAYVAGQRFIQLAEGLNVFNAAGRLKVLDRAGVTTDMARSRTEVLQAHALVLIWGSKASENAAHTVLSVLSELAVWAENPKQRVSNAEWDELLAKLTRAREEFLDVVRVELEVQG